MVYIILLKKEWSSLTPSFGVANYITTGRLIILLIAVFIYPIISHATFLLMLVTFIGLDYWDGRLARVKGQETAFGKYFDMEVDAFYVCCICYIIYINGFLDWWILIPGIMRYLSVLFEIVIKPKEDLEPRLPIASTIAVIFFISILSPFILERSVYSWILVSTSIALTCSFIYTFAHSIINRS